VATPQILPLRAFAFLLLRPPMIESQADLSHISLPQGPGSRWRPMGRAVLLCAAVALLGACTIKPVQPWEKGVLAKPEMSFDNDRLETLLAEHTYASKEAASGGNGVGGGGCGCN
jgi:hypothetical protein